MKLKRCRIATGWHEAGKRGYYFATIYHAQPWAVVVWDGDDDPDIHKAAGIELLSGTKWRAL